MRKIVAGLAPTGTETVLHAFGKNPDGRNPTSNLVTDTTGRLYGTAPLGGGTNVGVVFRVKE
ncbi:MAG TPA: choice-of-anchor tandem repeat GloVer-containing protein [Rhizomicrobium sp.]|nr:choice-of-anchor tandem repeat GloVer-containing protein [Rhizomicrobium sp.]